MFGCFASLLGFEETICIYSCFPELPDSSCVRIDLHGMLQVNRELEGMHLPPAPTNRAGVTSLLPNPSQPARLMGWHSAFKPGSQAVPPAAAEMPTAPMDAAAPSALQTQQQREGHPDLHALGAPGGAQSCYKLLPQPQQQQQQQPYGLGASRPGHELEQLQPEPLEPLPSLGSSLGLSGFLGTDGAATSSGGGFLQLLQSDPFPLQFATTDGLVPALKIADLGADDNLYDGLWFAQELSELAAADADAQLMRQPAAAAAADAQRMQQPAAVAGAQAMLQPAADEAGAQQQAAAAQLAQGPSTAQAAFEMPPGVLQPQHPMTKGALVVVIIIGIGRDGLPATLQQHLLRVKGRLGQGGNASVFRVGWCRLGSQLLADPGRPWEGIAAGQDVFACSAQVQQQQQQQAGVGPWVPDTAWQEDDRALKVSNRYVEHFYPAGASYSQYQTAYGPIMATEDMIAKRAGALSPHIVPTHGSGLVCCENLEQIPCLLLELAPLGSLDQLLYPNDPQKPRGPLSYDKAKVILGGVMRGLQGMHKTGAFHRDLKPANVLLFGPPDKPIAKLSDFGAAKQQRHPGDFGKSAHLATPAYLAPELMSDLSFQDARVDTFQAALLLVEARFGELPFRHLNFGGVRLGVYQARPRDYQNDLRNPDGAYNQNDRVQLQPDELYFLDRSLEADVMNRPTAEFLLEQDPQCSYLQ